MASAEVLEAIEEAFTDVLGVEPPPHDLDVVDAGLLDSLMIITLLAELESIFAIQIPFENLDLEEIRTLAGIAALVDRQPRGQRVEHAAPVDELLLPLRRGDAMAPVFLIPGSPGRPLTLRPLVDALDTDRSVYGLAALEMEDGRLPRVEEIAEEYLRVIEPVAGDGRYALGGLSFGGLVAFEMARRLTLAGAEVERLILVDTRVDRRALGGFARGRFVVSEGLRAIPYVAADPKRRGVELLHRAERALPLPSARRSGSRGRNEEPHPLPIGYAAQGYRPGTYPGDAVLMVTADRPLGVPVLARMWSTRVRGTLSVVPIPGAHGTFLRGGGPALIAPVISDLLRREELAGRPDGGPDSPPRPGSRASYTR